MTHPLTNALAMRTAAAEAVNSAREMVIHSGERRFIDGVRLGHDRSEAAILALPIEADHAELLREAVKLPEIAAMIEAAKELSRHFIPFSDDEFKAEYAMKAAISALDTL